MKQIIFSIKDFVIINELIDAKIYGLDNLKSSHAYNLGIERYYKDLIALRNRLSQVCIKIETSDINVEK